MACDDEDGFSPVALDHALHPRHYGPMQQSDGHVRITGPCGDTMEFWVNLRDDSVERVSFVTDGCGASRACGSMAVTLAEGKPLEQVLALEQVDILEALSGLPPESQHCALLAATTLRTACAECRPRDVGSKVHEASRDKGQGEGT